MRSGKSSTARSISLRSLRPCTKRPWGDPRSRATNRRWCTASCSAKSKIRGQLRADFPPALWTVIQGMLSPDPQLRLGPAASVARQLDAIAQLSFAQGRALLALTMERLFGTEKSKDLQDLAELRRLQRGPEERTEHSHVVARSRPHLRATASRAGPGWRRAGVALLRACFGSSFARPHRRTASSVAAATLMPYVRPRLRKPSPEASGSVDINVTVTPPGIAGVSIEIGGVVVPPTDSHRLVARGSLSLPVRVSAPGYQPLEAMVAPERDRTLVLALSPLPPVAPLVPRPTRTEHASATGQPSGVIKRYPF